MTITFMYAENKINVHVAAKVYPVLKTLEWSILFSNKSNLDNMSISD